ncbi:finger 212B-like isoform X2 [Octopus vulgaris]|uniref:Finger 212B-like isoform X2 n=3 Tax=Octopus TaxID=6643 RepID=A0AA36F1L5_OCTVU|nr:probable E3 SUMO-protein ligase RNF212 isoform X1 [Octopus sinensis]XP_036356968.1 probable E3 SUMO-protein ligase RNF212 isoform X1 [Octopus sinensis]CAI9719483.1 finger 212B-like isoform X2 [Octopus vulgaris]
MVDWLHCNLCFNQPGNGIKFSLTNCGHVYCEKCLNEGTRENCKMCKAVCNSILLTGKMKPDVEIFFGDPFELIKKQNRQLIQVFEFQKNHRRRFINYLRDKVNKQNAYIKQINQALQVRQDLQKDISKLMEENLYLKRLISEKGLNSGSRNSTPSRPSYLSNVQSHASPSLSPRENMSMYSRTTPNQQSLLPDVRISQSNMVFNTNSLGIPMSFRTPPSQSTSSDMGGNYFPPMSSRVSIRTPPSQGRIDSPHAAVVSMSPSSAVLELSKKFTR